MPSPPAGSSVWTTTSARPEPRQPGQVDRDGGGHREPAERQRRLSDSAPPGQACEQGDHAPMLASPRTGWSAHAPRAGKARRITPGAPPRRATAGPAPGVRVPDRRSSGRAVSAAERAVRGPSPHPRRSNPGRRRAVPGGRPGPAGAGGGPGRTAGRRPYGGGGPEGGGGGGAYCCCGWPYGGPAGRAAPAARTADPVPAGWPTAPRPPVRPAAPGLLRSSGSSARTANTRIAAAVSEAEQAQTEKSTSNVSIQANSVSTKPSAARPTVIQERGKPSFRSVKAGSSAQTVASRNRKNAVLTLPDLPAAEAEAEEVVAEAVPGEEAEDQVEQGAAGDDVGGHRELLGVERDARPGAAAAGRTGSGRTAAAAAARTRAADRIPAEAAGRTRAAAAGRTPAAGPAGAAAVAGRAAAGRTPAGGCWP